MSIYRTKLLSLVVLLILMPGCSGGGKLSEPTNRGKQATPLETVTEAFQYNTDPNYYTELYRPQYHLSPETGNMSDPNGMVYFEGEYHQFYQNSGQWGHAVSTDLIHWMHLPVALMRDSLGEIWSGSAVVDWNNTSGFFDGKPGLVAIFTHFQGGTQSQSIAYSADKGRTWTKYEGNPVIPNPGLKDFRDPKVFWHEDSKSWVMVVSVDNRVRFYTSPNLKQWEMTGEFGQDQGSHAAVWECPDLFELPVEGTSSKKWVLAVSIGNNTATKGSTAQYFVGSFDGKTFKNENPPSQVLWTDYGKDFYAAVSYSDIPESDGRRIYVGWMSNWRYPFNMPTGPRKGNMSIPRVLTLKDIQGKGLRLSQEPVKELENLRGKGVVLKAQDLAKGTNPLSVLKGTSYELDTEFTVSQDALFGLKLRMGESQETVIMYDASSSTLTLDRPRSGESAFEAGFAEKISAPLKAEDGRIKLRFYVDESTLEIFSGDGTTVLSSLVFPDATSNGLSVFLTQGKATLERAVFYPMKTVWRDEVPDGTLPLRILLGKASIDVPVGRSSKITSAVLPLTAPQELIWESGDESIAKVQSNGGTEAVIQGLHDGTVEIKARTPDGKIYAVINTFVFKP
ncbi:glycoside hydrolase family 32 protein [Paenibacillus sp. sgz500958]|uniref:glycoside hydrolase family 32 protein n=1 Tax=Paenibacillus sp. sgz500958 TaxID=3242475 RepID=UPI0036D3D08F